MVSLIDPFQDDDKNVIVTEKQEPKEVIKELQEIVTLVDMLRERDDLEMRLREVKDSEERLQEVDEMAERLQGVLEEELGEEAVDQLMAEENEDLRQAVEQAEVVNKEAVQITEMKEDEVDELEDEIKRVFFKGLLPEEKEVDTYQGSQDEVTDNSLLDDDLRKMLPQIETEGTSEVEDRTGSLDLEKTVPIIIYQRVERKTVTIVEKTEVMFESDGEMQEKLEERGAVTERLQPVDSSQEDTDVWFILFNTSPYKSAFKPPGKERDL